MLIPIDYPFFTEDGREYRFLTITYSNNHEQYPFKHQYYMLRDAVVMALEACCDYILVPEACQNGRLHWHAIIKVKRKKKVLFKNTLQKLRLSGMVFNKEVVNYLAALKYIYKTLPGSLLLIGTHNTLPISNVYRIKDDQAPTGARSVSG